ncbi:unnamed protein product [Pieris macdunnoughi]|uniref:Uncharacterized protein n=1 Tax=Pieris macdunnoughi TaxID=345717 RepID=A0A821NBW5_9NEOP|nr:unnamed protein product [Pieris macdunnoughi]
MVCDGRAMLCLESLVTRWRERGERGERRTRSRSLCSSAADGSLLQLLQRRASSAMTFNKKKWQYALLNNLNKKNLEEYRVEECQSVTCSFEGIFNKFEQIEYYPCLEICNS